MKNSYNLRIVFSSLLVNIILGNNNTINNVCKTFLDYYTDRDANPNCYHNPDVYLSLVEIVERRAYPIEAYTVTTEDGYILTMFRIPHGLNASEEKPGAPVFIQHGLFMSSMGFVELGKKSLAFVLADSGYDVWLGNFRGSRYSDKHEFLNKTDEDYWDFSFHEMGLYDLPAQLDFVVNKTRQKVFYIGFSMGTTAYFIYNSIYPDVAKERIRIAVNLAPVAFMGNYKFSFKVLMGQQVLNMPIDDIKQGGLNVITPEITAMKQIFCLSDPIKMRICNLMLTDFLFGFDCSQQDYETLPVVTMQLPDAASLKTLQHFMQVHFSKRFQHFDYKRGNAQRYGNATPPEYDLSKINVPNYFVRSDKDLAAPKEVVEKTYSALPQSARPFDIFVVPHEKFTHTDFVLAKDVKELVYDHVVEFLKSNGDKY